MHKKVMIIGYIQVFLDNGEHLTFSLYINLILY